MTALRHNDLHFTMPAGPANKGEELLHLNERIAFTELYLAQLRIRQRNARMDLSADRARRQVILSGHDHRFLHNLQDPAYVDALESALSAPAAPLDQKLAEGMRIVQDDGGDCDPSAQERAEDDALHAHLDATNGWDATHGDGDHLPKLDPDADFADQLVAEATAEVNQALNDYARHERERAAIEEREAMEALHSDQTCDASGQA
jgi:hypothetical protein